MVPWLRLEAGFGTNWGCGGCSGGGGGGDKDLSSGGPTRVVGALLVSREVLAI